MITVITSFQLPKPIPRIGGLWRRFHKAQVMAIT